MNLWDGWRRTRVGSSDRGDLVLDDEKHCAMLSTSGVEERVGRQFCLKFDLA